jgi:nucleotide-binding universal stress UspA family protein
VDDVAQVGAAPSRPAFAAHFGGVLDSSSAALAPAGRVSVPARVAGTIVVGYDGEAPARRALERAIDEAKAAAARLLIVAVVAMPLDPYAPKTFGTFDDSPPPRSPLLEPPQLRPLTDEALKRAETAGVAAEIVWTIGDPARTIIDTARDSGAAMIILGAHHHRLLGRLLGQDVAATVEHEAHCEVIVVE